jgi:hypothetical protein
MTSKTGDTHGGSHAETLQKVWLTCSGQLLVFWNLWDIKMLIDKMEKNQNKN